MRIAVLLPGFPRNYAVAKESLRVPYLEKHQCDFFIHSWHYPDKFPEAKYMEALSLFNPTKILIEKQIVFDTSTQRDQWGLLVQNTISQFYSVYRANQLKCEHEAVNNFKYDLVIRMRTDLRIVRPIPAEEVQPNVIGMYQWTQLGFGHMGLSDVFAIGSSKLMDVYASFAHNIPNYLSNDPTYNIPDGKTRPEYLLRHHLLTANNVPLQIFWHGDQTDPSFHLER